MSQGEGLAIFTTNKVITVAPDVLVRHKVFDAVRVVGSQERLPVSLNMDGEIMAFAPAEWQLLSPTPATEVGTTQATSTSTGNTVNFIAATGQAKSRAEDATISSTIAGEPGCTKTRDVWEVDLVGRPLRKVSDWNKVMEGDFNDRVDLAPELEDDNSRDNDHDGDRDLEYEAPKPSAEDPGLYAGINADDDNANAQQDRKDGTATMNEDDLQLFLLKVTNAPENAEVYIRVDTAAAESARTRLRFGNGKRGRIKVWRERTKGETLLLDMDKADKNLVRIPVVAPMVSSYWIEGMELSNTPRDVVLTLGVIDKIAGKEFPYYVDTLDVTVIGPSAQRIRDEEKPLEYPAEYGGLIHADEELIKTPGAIGTRPGRIHCYVFSPAYSTDGGPEDYIEPEIFSYNSAGIYWQKSTGGFTGGIERHAEASLFDIAAAHLRMDQEFLTREQGGFYIVDQAALSREGDPASVVGAGGGRAIVRLFKDLVPETGIRPPGWMVKVTDNMIDLDRMSPITDKLQNEDTEMTGYPAVAINLDDDDNDGGDDVRDPTPDMSDTNGVEGENDLLKLRIHKVTLPGIVGVGKLTYSGDRIAIYQDPNKKTRVVSGVTEFASNQDHTVYVEGRYQSPSLREGEIVVLTLWENGHAICEDRVRVAVAYPMIVVYDRGPDYDDEGEIIRSRPITEKWLNFVALDRRVNPWIIPGTGQKGIYYSVHIFDTERLAKIAFGTRDAHVAVVAHGSYGMGILFKENPERISDFMNVGRKMTPIRQFKRPGFVVDTSEYGDDSATAEPYDPIETSILLDGHLERETIQSYGHESLISPGEHFRFVPGDPAESDPSKQVDHHDQTNYAQMGKKQLIVKVGSADLPTLRYKTLLLNACFSGRYFYPVFRHGTLFYTRDRCGALKPTINFLGRLMNGETYDETLTKVNSELKPPLFDYHVFP